jgi:hypothetical protein
VGDTEARLLALERRVWRFPVGELEKRAAALEQNLWQSWGNIDGAAVSDCTTDFASICPCVPLTLPLRDTYYGDTTLTYDPVNFWWTGCEQISYPGTVLCSARSAPIRYTLFGDDTDDSWVLTVTWHGSGGGTNCPSASKTCSDTLNQTQTDNSDFLCPPDLTLWNFTGGTQGSIYPTGINPTLMVGYPTITGCSTQHFPWTLYALDSVYGSWTLEFNGVFWSQCRSITTSAWTGAGACASVTTAVTLRLLTDGTCQVLYRSAAPAGDQCPQNGVACSTAPNVTKTSGSLTFNDCDPLDATVTVSGSTWKVFGDAAATGVTIDFSTSVI